MIKLELIPWKEAKLYIEREETLGTNAYYDLLKYYPNFPEVLKTLLSALDLAEQEATQVEDMPALSLDFMKSLNVLLIYLLGLIELYPQDDWSKLINSVISILDNYVGFYETITTTSQDEAGFKAVVTFKEKLQHCAKVLELHHSIETLVPALAILCDRVEILNTSNPTPLQLSREYLEALNFYPTNENTTGGSHDYNHV